MKCLLFSFFVILLYLKVSNAALPTWILDNGEWTWTGEYDRNGLHRDISDRVASYKRLNNRNPNSVRDETDGPLKFQEMRKARTSRESVSHPENIGAFSRGQSREQEKKWTSYRDSPGVGSTTQKFDGMDEEATEREIYPNDENSLVNPVSFHVYAGPNTNTQYRQPGFNAAASNNGGLQIWNTQRRIRSKREAIDCCKKVIVSSTGPASQVQWDRIGIYLAKGDHLHGRTVYNHENWTQSIFYLYGEFDGWLIGPTPGENFGGVKNNHDGMCVHSADPIQAKDWSYYAGTSDTRNPELAFPHWKQDDSSLTVRCVPKTLNIDSQRVSDPSRGPQLLQLYKKVRPVLIDHCGMPLTHRLNMDAWRIKASCAGTCHITNISLSLVHGEADLLLVAVEEDAPADEDLSSYCFQCADTKLKADRLLAGSQLGWSLSIPGREFTLYTIIVGYSDYVSLNIRLDSPNLSTARSELYN